ncbi:hypothetical protein MG293_008118 [Ovis ammon polii]|uniref:Uncharacterized protein n=1 Tax=Ovis ammon polii TaxID=230172 RepID=A0AAD4U9K4_OVIAM|nr:hypothetical protein MG293_008118 [Ovis ammon polii]
MPPQRPSPLHLSSLLPKKKKKRPKQHVTTYPAKYIQICLPKEGKKRKTEKIIIMTIMLLDRCGFNPERKNIRSVYLLCDQVLVLFPLSLLPIAFWSFQQGKVTFKALRAAVRSRTYLGPPLGTGSLQTREKSARENRGELGAGASPRVRESGRAGSGGASSLRRSLTRSERAEPSWTLRVPLLKISHPNLLPYIPICSYTTKDFSLPRQ